MAEPNNVNEHVSLTDEVNRIARVLMDEWERVEGKPVNISYVATFADMARAVLADLGAHKQREWSTQVARDHKVYFEREAAEARSARGGSPVVTRTVVTLPDIVSDWVELTPIRGEEARTPDHECDTGYFDRAVCPEPCGTMHSYCATCGKPADPCPFRDALEQED